MRILLAGASGYLGSALVTALKRDGHDLVRLVRRQPAAADEVRWDPQRGTINVAQLGAIDAAVCLSGAGVGDRRWTPAYKKVIRDSRVESTHTFSLALAELPTPPQVFVSGSAIGFYGDTGDTVVDESSPTGDTFLAGVVRDWEAASTPAVEAGIRTVYARTGVVLGPGGGALKPLWPLLRFGVAGPLSLTGGQCWSWITLKDHVACMKFLLQDPRSADLAGPVNITAPEPATNKAVVQALAHRMHRPALLPVPGPALRLVLGEFAGEILGSQRVVPRRLIEAGHRFNSPDIERAAVALVP